MDTHSSDETNHSLVVGEPVEELADVADAEQGGGVQVRQNLNQNLRREPEEEIRGCYNEDMTAAMLLRCSLYAAAEQFSITVSRTLF